MKKNILMLICVTASGMIYGQSAIFSKDAWGNTVQTDQYGNTQSIYSKDAWGNTVQTDQYGNKQGTYSKDAWGNTIYQED